MVNMAELVQVLLNTTESLSKSVSDVLGPDVFVALGLGDERRGALTFFILILFSIASCMFALRYRQPSRVAALTQFLWCRVLVVFGVVKLIEVTRKPATDILIVGDSGTGKTALFFYVCVCVFYVSVHIARVALWYMRDICVCTWLFVAEARRKEGYGAIDEREPRQIHSNRPRIQRQGQCGGFFHVLQGRGCYH